MPTLRRHHSYPESRRTRRRMRHGVQRIPIRFRAWSQGVPPQIGAARRCSGECGRRASRGPTDRPGISTTQTPGNSQVQAPEKFNLVVTCTPNGKRGVEAGHRSTMKLGGRSLRLDESFSGLGRRIAPPPERFAPLSRSPPLPFGVFTDCDTGCSMPASSAESCRATRPCLFNHFDWPASTRKNQVSAHWNGTSNLPTNAPATGFNALLHVARLHCQTVSNPGASSYQNEESRIGRLSSGCICLPRLQSFEEAHARFNMFHVKHIPTPGGLPPPICLSSDLPASSKPPSPRSSRSGNSYCRR